MIYRVQLEKTEEGYAVWCPGLPGCWSQGESEEEALVKARIASGWLIPATLGISVG